MVMVVCSENWSIFACGDIELLPPEKNAPSDSVNVTPFTNVIPKPVSIWSKILVGLLLVLKSKL